MAVKGHSEQVWRFVMGAAGELLAFFNELIYPLCPDGQPSEDGILEKSRLNIVTDNNAGDVKFLQLLTAINNQRNKILGLYAPITTVNANINSGFDPAKAPNLSNLSFEQLYALRFGKMPHPTDNQLQQPELLNETIKQLQPHYNDTIPKVSIEEIEAYLIEEDTENKKKQK